MTKKLLIFLGAILIIVIGIFILFVSDEKSKPKSVSPSNKPDALKQDANVKYYPYTKEAFSNINPNRTDAIFISDLRGDGQIIEVPRDEFLDVLRERVGFNVLFPKYLPTGIALSPIGVEIDDTSGNLGVSFDFVEPGTGQLSQAPLLFTIKEAKADDFVKDKSPEVYAKYLMEENRVKIGNIEGYQWTYTLGRKLILFNKNGIRTVIGTGTDSAIKNNFPNLTDLGGEILKVAGSM